jgi:cyanate permease
MPRNAALALSVACTAGACGLLLAGMTIPGMALLVVSVGFDALFVLALRAERKERL